MVDIATRWEGKPIVQKPYAGKQYNLYMGGVDQVDQQLHSVHILCKTYKWYREFALRLTSQAVLNAHKLFVKRCRLKDVTFLKFMHRRIVLTLQFSPKLNNSTKVNVYFGFFNFGTNFYCFPKTHCSNLSMSLCVKQSAIC